VAKWTGLALVVLVLMLWAVSSRSESVFGDDGSVAGRFAAAYLYQGRFFLLWASRRPSDGQLIGFVIPSSTAGFTLLKFPDQGGWGLILPLWIVLLTVALPISFLFWRDRRRIPPHCCQSCGYDLTGNTSGTCPECGGKAICNREGCT
jgi:hypothetical protein